MIYLNITLFETFTLTISETFTKKNPLQNLARFHDWLFELEILEVFTTVFFANNYYFNSSFFASTAECSP